MRNNNEVSLADFMNVFNQLSKDDQAEICRIAEQKVEEEKQKKKAELEEQRENEN